MEPSKSQLMAGISVHLLIEKKNDQNAMEPQGTMSTMYTMSTLESSRWKVCQMKTIIESIFWCPKSWRYHDTPVPIPVMDDHLIASQRSWVMIRVGSAFCKASPSWLRVKTVSKKGENKRDIQWVWGCLKRLSLPNRLIVNSHIRSKYTQCRWVQEQSQQTSKNNFFQTPFHNPSESVSSFAVSIV